MTIRQAVEAVDRLKPNTYSDQEKLRWLGELETLVREQITGLYEENEEPVAGFDETAGKDTALTAPAPYDQMYLRYLEAQIDYHNAEFDRYNNAIALFQTAFDSYRNACARTNIPQGAAFRYF